MEPGLNLSNAVHIHDGGTMNTQEIARTEFALQGREALSDRVLTAADISVTRISIAMSNYPQRWAKAASRLKVAAPWLQVCS